MAPLHYAANFDPFLSLDCAPTPSVLAQSKEKKGSKFCHLATLLADYISSGKISWTGICGFVTRIVLSEHVPKLPDDKLYKKILVMVWMWSFLVLG